jgi:hypothetical protein
MRRRRDARLGILDFEFGSVEFAAMVRAPKEPDRRKRRAEMLTFVEQWVCALTLRYFPGQRSGQLVVLTLLPPNGVPVDVVHRRVNSHPGAIVQRRCLDGRYQFVVVEDYEPTR